MKQIIHNSLKIHKIIFSLCLCAATLFTTGCKDKSENIVKIGLLHSTTGSMAFSEKAVLNAELMAVDVLNNSGGVLGHKIEVVEENGESDYRIFEKKARKLIETDKVVSILKTLYSKIANNKEINDNLSQQIQAIYSNEFDPTTHTPSGVLADICAYSSDRIPVSELSVSTYYSTENIQPNKKGSVDATSLPSITQTTGCHKGDVLISNIRPYFKKIVYVTDDSCGCSTDVLCFVPKEDQYSAFLFGTLYMDRFFDYMAAGSKGTKMPRGDKQQIMNYPVVLPDKESLDLFNGLIGPMLDQIATNRIESSRLATLRDALLPKLMSGELDVSELDI